VEAAGDEPLTGPPKGLAAAMREGTKKPRPASPARSRSGPTSAPPSGPAPGEGKPAPDLDSGLFGAAPTGWEGYDDLDTLAEAASGCTRCPLSQGRTQVVFGSGSPRADLMFIGEAPGAQEDLQGLPFVGPAGALLTKIIEAIDLTRDEVYIANIVKCRPPGNRDPLPAEVKECRGYLERQIDLVAPKVIVALGRVAAQTLLDSEMPLGRLRGRWHSVRGVAVRATYHPAALLRNSSWKRPTWEDMKIVRERLDEA